METKNEVIFEDLRKRIESENHSEKKRKHFSKATRQEIENLLRSGYAVSFLSQQLGVSEQTFSNWRRSLKKPILQPRKLTVVSAPFETSEHVQAVLPHDRIEVQLPNGIVLKNIALDSRTLELLKRF